jgi:hypothetical protein
MEVVDCLRTVTIVVESVATWALVGIFVVLCVGVERIDKTLRKIVELGNKFSGKKGD